MLRASKVALRSRESSVKLITVLRLNRRNDPQSARPIAAKTGFKPKTDEISHLR